MIAMCRGWTSSSTGSDLQDLAFLAVGARVDCLDVPVGQPLEVLELAALLVLAQVAVAERVLQRIRGLASVVPDLDTRFLRPSPHLLDHLAPALLGQGRDVEADDGAVD